MTLLQLCTLYSLLYADYSEQKSAKALNKPLTPLPFQCFPNCRSSWQMGVNLHQLQEHTIYMCICTCGICYQVCTKSGFTHNAIHHLLISILGRWHHKCFKEPGCHSEDGYNQVFEMSMNQPITVWCYDPEKIKDLQATMKAWEFL